MYKLKMIMTTVFMSCVFLRNYKMIDGSGSVLYGLLTTGELYKMLTYNESPCTCAEPSDCPLSPAFERQIVLDSDGNDVLISDISAGLSVTLASMLYTVIDIFLWGKCNHHVIILL